MFTLAYPFRPWLGDKAIAEGGDILSYIGKLPRNMT